jgi:Rad3-related DNA helicase
MRTYSNELVAAGVILPEPQAYVLTSQKVLQDQYARDFSEFAKDLRSSANFACKWIEGQTCAETMRIERALKQSRVVNYIGCTDVCPYRASKQEFLDAQTGITNYSYFLSETVYAGALGVRELIVFDEAHHIEDEMRRWGTTSISRNVAMKLLHLKFPHPRADSKSMVRWVEDEYSPAAKRLLEKLLGSIRSKVSKRAHVLSPDIVHELARRYEWLDKHVCQMNRFLEATDEEKSNYLVERDHGTDDERINLKPLDVRPYVRDLLYAKGRKKLLMSATVLDEATFKRNNGVPSSDRVASMCIPTSFDPNAFGIVFEPIGKMSKKHIDTNIGEAVAKIKQILDRHPNDKGIIHTVSYAISERLKQVDDKRLIFQNSGDTAAEIIKRHVEDPGPTVMVAPAMIEGIDLYDDLGRLQIICKVPYPYIGDPVISAKMKLDPEWYAWRTIMSVVQAIGRCVRSKDDWAHTYILDECFGDLFMKWSRMFPAHFQKMQIVDRSS